MQKVKSSVISIFASALLLMFMASCSSNEMAFHKRKYQPWFASHHTKLDKKADQVVAEEAVTVASESSNQTSTSDEIVLENTAYNEVVVENNVAENTKSEIVATPKRKAVTRAVKLAKSDNVVREIETVFAANEEPKKLMEDQSEDDIEMILYIILAIIFPPLAVFLIHGLETEFWLSLILTILGYVPGQIYAIYLVLKKYGKV